MPDDYKRYKPDHSSLSEGLGRHLRETLEGGDVPEEIYRTSLDDSIDKKLYSVNITARTDGHKIRITERDSRYSEMEPLESEINIGNYRVVVNTNKIPYGLKGKHDPNTPLTPDETRELVTEAVQRFVVGVNYRVGVGPLTDEEKKEEKYDVPYNRKKVLEDLLQTMIIFGSGLSLFWLFSNQKITANVVTVIGLTTNTIYGVLAFIFVLGILFLLRKPIMKLLGKV